MLRAARAAAGAEEGGSGGVGGGGVAGGSEAAGTAGTGGSVDHCAPGNPCLNGGTCSNGATTFACACTANFTGKICDLSRFEVASSFALSAPTGISSDGSVVISALGSHAAKYVAGKPTDLGVYAGDTVSSAFGVNQDGSLIVGTSASKTGSVFNYHPVTWAGASISLLPGGTNCQAMDVSADGTVIAGLCSGSVVRWVNGVYEDLALAGAPGFSNLKISHDGVWIAGTYTANSSTTGFVWSKASGLRLATVAGKFSMCAFTGISGNGGIAIGNCTYSGTTKVAVTWDATNGLKLFPGVDAANPPESRADAVSGDGSYVTGRQITSVRWDSARSLHTLSTLVPAVLTSAWTFDVYPVYVSSDGMTLTGEVYDARGDSNGVFIMRTGN